MTTASGADSQPPKRKFAAAAVTAGILLSRLSGLARDRALAYYLGNSEAAGAFRAALRVPNLLQMLFGEGSLSASFIPVYAKLKAEGRHEEASRVAGTVLGLLTTVTVLIVALGVTFSETLLELLAPGFTGQVRQLTSDLVRIIFPGVGLLVISAWCLGVLNSHRKFFLPYVAPVLWNVAIVASLLAFAFFRHGTDDLGLAPGSGLAHAAAVGASLGAFFQLAVQLPSAIKLNGGLHPSLKISGPSTDPVPGHVRIILRNFFPAVLSRGGVQLSAYIDQVLASYLGPVVVAAMANAQTLYTLPIALFGTAIAAAELPEMSVATGNEQEVNEALRGRLKLGLTRIAFFIIPSAVAFVGLGDVIAGTLYQTGRFTHADAISVWILLVGSAVGLLATTQSRLCISAFWALRDTRTPTRFALIRVALTGSLGVIAVFPLRQALDLSPMTAGSAMVASAGVSGWIEFLLIRRALSARIGQFAASRHDILRCWGLALAAVGAALGIKQLLGADLPVLAAAARSPILTGVLVLGTYCTVYVGGSVATGAGEAQALLRRVVNKVRRR